MGVTGQAQGHSDLILVWEYFHKVLSTLDVSLNQMGYSMCECVGKMAKTSFYFKFDLRLRSQQPNFIPIHEIFPRCMFIPNLATLGVIA